MRRLSMPLAVLVAYLAMWLRWGPGGGQFDFGDLLIYRRGADAVTAGTLYVTRPGERPFTYPPFSAIAFEPLAALGRTPAILTMTALSVVAFVVLAVVSARATRLPASVAVPAVIALAVVEPVLRTLRLGQVNLVLVAMVAVDCLVLSGRRRGWLVGVAAGVKLTPGVFVVYLLLRREWASAARAAGGFALTVAVSAVIAPRDTWLYWTKLFFDPGHIGGYAYVDNQSLYGVVVRLARTEHPPTVLTGVLAVLALVIGALACRSLLARGRDLAALTALAYGGLLASPVSWSHHWVWVVPAVLVLLEQRAWGSAAVMWLASFIAAWWWTPYGGLKEFDHTWWQATACVTLTATALVFWAAVTRVPTSDREPALV